MKQTLKSLYPFLLIGIIIALIPSAVKKENRTLPIYDSDLIKKCDDAIILNMQLNYENDSLKCVIEDRLFCY